MKEESKLAVGVKVYSENLQRNLIIAYPLDSKFENSHLWMCIDPNLCMNESRCAIFRCSENNLQIGWR